MEKNFKEIIDSIIRKLKNGKDYYSKDDDSVVAFIDDGKLNKTDIDEPYDSDESKCKIIL